MKIIVASGGRFHSIHLAEQLLKRNLLYHFYSWACSRKENAYFDAYLTSSAMMEYFIYFYEKIRLQKIISLSTLYVWYDNAFDRWLSKQLAKEGSFDVLVGWSHYILHSIPRARDCGASIVLEMGSMHILENKKILEQELAKHGFFAPAIDQRNINKMLSEYAAVDTIVVPSSHVKESFILNGIAAEKIEIIPYGTNIQQFVERSEMPRIYRVLFVGRVGLAKGIHYLLEAWDQLGFSKKRAELHIVGPLDEQVRIYLKKRKNNDSVFFHGGVSHAAVATLYQQASLFVLPSLQEGLAMVLIEAMASGLPVIGTTRTGLQDLIVNGREGFIIPPSQVDSLVERLLWGFYNQKELFSMGKNAAQKAREYSWDMYGDRVVSFYASIVQKKYGSQSVREKYGKTINL